MLAVEYNNHPDYEATRLWGNALNIFSLKYQVWVAKDAFFSRDTKSRAGELQFSIRVHENWARQILEKRGLESRDLCENLTDDR